MSTGTPTPKRWTKWGARTYAQFPVRHACGCAARYSTNYIRYAVNGATATTWMTAAPASFEAARSIVALIAQS